MPVKEEGRWDREIEPSVKRLRKVFRLCEDLPGRRKFDGYFDEFYRVYRKRFKGPARKGKLRAFHEQSERAGRKSTTAIRALLNQTYERKRISKERRATTLSRWDQMFRYVLDNKQSWIKKMSCSEFIRENGGAAGCAQKYRDKR